MLLCAPIQPGKMAEAFQIHGGRGRSLVAVFRRGIFSDGGQARSWYARDQARVERGARAPEERMAPVAQRHRAQQLLGRRRKRAPQGRAHAGQGREYKE